MAVLLKQLLKSPKTSSSLLVYDPFRDPDRQELVREVIGLANADVEGPRFILFGVNSAALESSGIVGISEASVADLKKAHRLVSRLVEPTLELAFIYDKVDGKLVGALEVDGCDFGPYFVGQDFSDTLVRGQCWIRDGRDLCAVSRAELLQSQSPPMPIEPALLPEHIDVSIGFNDEPDCHYLEVEIPDTSNPPFADEHEKDSKPATIAQVIRNTVDTVTTQIQRLNQGSLKKPNGAASDTSATDLTEDAGRIFADAQNHYYFEERAIKLNFCIRNRGEAPIKGATLELAFPRIPDFDVADRIYVSPFDKRSPNEIKNMGYPNVDSQEEVVFVRSDAGLLNGGSTQSALRCPLRMAVGPRMQGRKVGIRYTLRGPNGSALSKGALKLRFGQSSDA